jgi:hypothetical protein
VTQEHVIRYLDQARKYALEDAKPFFAWLARRRGVEPVLIPAHGGGLQQLRPLPRRLIHELFLEWTAQDANPQWALPALLSLIHQCHQVVSACCGSETSSSRMAHYACEGCLS